MSYTPPPRPPRMRWAVLFMRDDIEVRDTVRATSEASARLAIAAKHNVKLSTIREVTLNGK